MQSLTNIIRHTKISCVIPSLVFRRFLCGTYWNGLHRGTSKLRHSKYLNSTNRVNLIPFVRNPHFSKLMHRVWYCVSKITGHHFPGWVWKLELRTRGSIKSHSLLLAKDMFFRKQKFDVKQFKMNKFIFDVKQLKINKFINSTWQLIISTSNPTLEVSSLRPCMLKCDYNKVTK